MTWVTHTSWVERQHDGVQALDLDGAGADAVNLAIVTDAVVNPDTDTTYPGTLTAVATATGWTGPVALANLTCGLDGSFDNVFDADDPSVIAQDAGGFANGRSLVIYETTNGRILGHHTEGAAFGNVAGPITITFNAAGILKWTMT